MGASGKVNKGSSLSLYSLWPSNFAAFKNKTFQAAIAIDDC